MAGDIFYIIILRPIAALHVVQTGVSGYQAGARSYSYDHNTCEGAAFSAPLTPSVRLSIDREAEPPGSGARRAWRRVGQT